MKAATSREELITGRFHIDALAVGADDRVALAASSLTTNAWDGLLQILRWPAGAADGGVEVQASFATSAGNASVAWLNDEALAAGNDDGSVSPACNPEVARLCVAAWEGSTDSDTDSMPGLIEDSSEEDSLSVEEA